MVKIVHWWFDHPSGARSSAPRRFGAIGFSKDIKILDAGCGNGGNLSFLSGLGDVTALEAVSGGPDEGYGPRLCRGCIKAICLILFRRNCGMTLIWWRSLADAVEHID